MNVKETAPAYLTQKKDVTYQDYLELPEDGQKYEIINGEFVKTPAPQLIHQRVSVNLMYEFQTFAKLNHAGEVLCAPVDVVLTETNVVQPDILFITTKNSGIAGEKNVSGAPDLLIEIISPDSGYYDMVEKKDLYEKFGVKEYWIVDPKKKWIEIYVNEEGKFKLLQRQEDKGVLASKVLRGFQIPFSTIFNVG